MTWIHPLREDVGEPVDVLGGKAHGLIVLRRLGLPVPPGFVITTEACRAYLRDGRFPEGLDDELAAAVAELEAATGQRLGGPERPLAVSVRSGASVSMPGMMTTVLNLGLDVRDDVRPRLRRAVAAVFSSWDSPRAKTYRELHDVPHDLGTAVTVQAMVYGDRDGRSGAGVAFSRDPNTGEPVPYGDVLFGRQGDDVVSGVSATRPLADLADREPAVWDGLLDALNRVEKHLRDACYLEFTFESGKLWILQVRSGGFTGAAAVRVAVDLADEGLIDRREALRRVTPAQRQHARTPRLAPASESEILTRGIGASPGVAAGRVAMTSEDAVRMAADGPVILVRPETSPHDLRGLAAAAGVLTARGGPASHAAVVARSMGKPAVVGAAELTIHPEDRTVRAGGRTLPEGTRITLDGTSGEVVVGRAVIVTGEDDPYVTRLLAWDEEVRDP